jgi:site-specific recombinase XerD
MSKQSQIEELVDSFLNYLFIQKGLSQNTINSYKHDLKKFVDANKTLDIKGADFDSFLHNINTLELSPKSKQRLISSLKQFHIYLSQLSVIDHEFPKGVRIKLGSSLPRVLSINEVDSFINFYDHSNFLNSRNKTILDFLYSAGTRVSELCNVELSDIDLDDNFVQLKGKGSKYRIVPIGSLLRQNLTEYLTYRNNLKSINSFLFLSKSHKQMERTAVFRIIKKTTSNLGLDSDIHPHTFRHSAATHMLEGGCDLRTVQEFLGHSSVSTTQIYTKITKEFLEEAFIESHPRS